MTEHNYILTESAPAGIDGTASLIETELTCEHAPPDFVLNLSGQQVGDWLSKTYVSPAKRHRRHQNAYLFGQNFIIDDGTFFCESETYRLQYVEAFERPAYKAIYPGPRPRLSREAECWQVSFSQENAISLCEPVFLATPVEPDNWGRWISTVVPKALWFLANPTGRKFLCRSKHKWQIATLAALGIAEGNTIDHDPGRIYQCADLETINYSATNLAASPGDVKSFSKLARQYGDKKLFVSRLGQSIARPRYRVLENERELLDGVRDLGFQIIEPETLSFFDQLSAFAAASTVAGLGGAGMFNTAFCRPGSKVVTIEASDRFIRAHARFFASLGHRYGVVFGKRNPEDANAVHGRWSVDVNAVVNCLRLI